MGGTSEAERVLRQKFELLKRKRQQELQEQEQERRRGGGHGLGGRSSKPFAPPPLAHDPVRLAAVAALKAKREEKQGDKALSSEPPEKKRLTVSGKPTSIKLGFKVSSGVAKPANVAPQSGQPPESLAPLENKPVPRLKRPVLRRPAVVRKVDSSQGDQPEDQSQPEDNFEKQPLEETKEAYNNQAEGDMTSSLPSAPQVVVSGLPEFYTSDMLWEFFSEFHDVVDAQIDHGLGYITFSSFEDAHAVLDFQAHQPILVDDEHAINIEWAVQVDQTNSTVPEVLQEKEPLEETAQVATRDVVSYDDL